MNPLIESDIRKISEIAGYMWNRGWSERNAGNISLDLTDFISIDINTIAEYPFISVDLPQEAAHLKIFITGTGERLRDLIHHPDHAGAIISINENASGYHIIWGGKSSTSFKPTSEFISHLLIHIMNRKLQNQKRCVLHTHPIELIALSHDPKLNKNEPLFNKILWSMLPEVRVFVPRGIAITPYVCPGSIELAQLTLDALKTRDVILWSKHGALSTGIDAMEAFDLIDVANKGAQIYLKCLQAGFEPEGLSDDQLMELEKFI